MNKTALFLPYTVGGYEKTNEGKNKFRIRSHYPLYSGRD